jgi:hypothetical protein
MIPLEQKTAEDLREERRIRGRVARATRPHGPHNPIWKLKRSVRLDRARIMAGQLPA